MRLKAPPIWQWNDRSVDRIQAEARFAPPRQVPIAIDKTPVLVQIGHYLIEIASIFKKLRFSYLGDEERRELAPTLTEAFLHLQRLAASSVDWEMRQEVTRYLVALGSIGVQRQVVGKEGLSRTGILLEALAKGRLQDWLTHLYSGLHGLTETGPTGRTIHYHVPQGLLDNEWNMRTTLFHWLEQRESR